VGSQTEIVFDGGSLVMDKDSNLVMQLPLFEEAIELREQIAEIRKKMAK
jgi:NAD+ synthase (glutamine-hydrolysing)